jgi:hypothetical protein
MLNRAVAVITWIVLAAMPALAQPAPKRPACSQSMIVGTWQAIFTPGVANPIAPGFPLYPNFACAVTVAANGTVTTGNCALNDNFSLTKQPAGSLTIDRTCHVVGTTAFRTDPAQRKAILSFKHRCRSGDPAMAVGCLAFSRGVALSEDGVAVGHRPPTFFLLS